jgi:hypothetical protein
MRSDARSAPCGGAEAIKTPAESIMPLQILLHYIATHGVADNYGGAIETIDRGQHVIHIVLNGASIERLFRLALTMPAQTYRCSAKSFAREVIEEMLVPAPGAMPATVNKSSGTGCASL